MKATWIGLFFLAGSAGLAQQYVISTYAGGASPPAGAFGAPLGVAVDAEGSVYFTCTLDFVFKLDSRGILTLIAGHSRTAQPGDGGPATGARLQLHCPCGDPRGGGLAVDSAGNIFIADTFDNRVRRISSDGIITTVAGGGNGGLGDGGPAVAAQLNLPWDVAVDDAGNLFIADVGSNRVRKVARSGIITTVAGDGTYGFSGDGAPATHAALNQPRGISIDGLGNLFIADAYNFRIRKVSADGIITTVAGNGTRGVSADGIAATGAPFDFATRLVADRAGNLFIADGSRVRKVSPDGLMTTIAGNGTFTGNMFSVDGGPATNAEVYPLDIAKDGAGNLFIADIAGRILKVSVDATLTTSARSASEFPFPSGDGGPAIDARLGVGSVAVDRAGNLFIAGTSLRKVSQNGIITTVEEAPGGVLALDSAGDLFIARVQRVRKVTPDGLVTAVAGNGTPGYSGDGGPALNAQLGYVGGIAVDGSGNLFISDVNTNRVRKVSPDGIITTVAGNGTAGFSGDGGSATSAQLNEPLGLATDTGGNLFIADSHNNRVRKVSQDGIITTVVADNTCCYSGVAVDAFGNLFIAIAAASDDEYATNLADYIRKVSPNGTVTTVAGSGTSGYSGDGGPAIMAQLKGSVSVTVDGGGNVFVADSGNNAVRVLRPTNYSTLIGAVVDAANQRAEPVSPGKIVVIYGVDLGPAELIGSTAVNGRIGTELSGTAVSFNGIAAPILYTSSTQVAAIVPYAITGASAQATVTYRGRISAALTVPVALSSPNLFTLNQTGAGEAAAINAVDHTVNTAANPAKTGDYVSLYATGEGQTVPAGEDGKLVGPTPTRPVLPVNVTVGGIPAVVQYAGGAPGQVAGLMQINVQIPAGVQPGGYVPVILQVGTASTTPGPVWVAVSGN